MDFFGMGIGEIILVLIVALIIWGPGKMPEIARTLGRAVSTLRKSSSDLTAQIRKELEEEERDHSPHPEASSSAKPIKSLTTDMPEAGSVERTDPEDR